MLHTPRIRCNYCERRIPASSVICPNCQRNPRAFYWKRSHVLIILVILALALGGAALLFSNDLKSTVPIGLALNLSATPTRADTRPPVTVILVATPLPGTPTNLPSTETRVVPTSTPSPTLAATLTAALTATLTRTATRRPANISTQVALPTEPPTPIPTIAALTPPTLLGPADNEQIIGGNKRVTLRFQPAQPLGAQEWHRIQVDYLDRSGNPVSWCAFTKQSEQEFPREFFDDSSPSVRSFLWRVNIVRSNQISPSTCDAPYDPLSAPSDVWTFYWY